MARAHPRPQSPARKTGARRPAPPRPAREEELRDPGKLDFERAEKVAKRLVRDNGEWFKEMAQK